VNNQASTIKGRDTMDFDKTILLSNIIDARRCGDTERLSHLILRYLSTFNDGLIYTPEGIGKLMQNMTNTLKRTTYRNLESLTKRSILHKLDENSLQLNDQFSSKGTKPVRYKGPRLIYDRDEQEFIFALDAKRAELWELRGKNKKHIKEDIMMHPTVKKEFDSLRQQIDTMLEILKSVASGSGEAKEKAATHLKLIEGGLKD
jgi:hypothetical protein